MQGAPLQASPRVRFFGQCPVWLRALSICLLVASFAWLGSSGIRLWKKQDLISLQEASIVSAQALLSAPSHRQISKDSKRPVRDFSQLSDSAVWSAEQRRQIIGVIRNLNTPWQDLFEQLEQETPKNVALLNLEIDAQRGILRLQAEATSLETLLVYADRMKNRGAIGSISYSKHETNDQDPTKPIRLSVEYGLQSPSPLPSVALAAKESTP